MLYTKHKRFNLLRNALIFLCVPVLFITLASTLFFGDHAYAANKYSPEQMAAAWEAGIAFSNCSNSSGYDKTQTAEDINKGGIFNVGITPGADAKIVGYLVKPDSGSVDCESPSDVLQLFSAIGESSPLDFLKKVGVYGLNSDKTAYETKLSSDAARGSAIKNAVASKFGLNYSAGMPKDLQYAELNATFVKKCRSSEDSSGIAVKIVDSTGKVTTKNYVLKGGQNDVTEVGYSLDGDGGNDQMMSCPTIVNQMNKMVTDYSNTVTANVNDGNPSNDPGQTNGSASGLSDSHPTCEANGDPLTWIMCPIFNGVAGFSDWMFRNMVEPLLRVSPVSTDPNNGSFQVWSNFRIYGNIILIISMLVIVFGQAIGGGLIDAYTAKKVMPRILVAAILVNLSVYLIAIAVDITNILGGGVGQLLTAPFKDASMFQFSPNASQSISIVGLTGAAGIGAYLSGVFFASAGVGIISAGASWLALFVLLPAVLGIIGAFVTLIIRQALLLVLIMISPVAFALYCLPNTEKYFKKWFELLVKTLVVYPVVILIFAGADILSVTVMKANDFGNGPLLTQQPANTLAAIVAFVAQFLPLVMIPWAFKFAGGAIGQMYQSLSGFGKKGHEFFKGNVNDPNSRQNRARKDLKAGVDYGRWMKSQELSAKSAKADARIAAGIPGGKMRSRFYRGASRFALSPGLEARVSANQEAESKRIQAQKATGPDPSIRDAWAVYDSEAGVYWNPLRGKGLYERDANGLYYDKSDLTWNASKGKYEANAGAVGRYSGTTTGGFTDAAGNSIGRDRLGLNTDAVVSESSVKNARANAMSNPAAFQETLNYEMEKAAENDEMGRLRSRYAALTQELGMTEQDASNTWKVVGYRQQGTHLIEKFSGFKDVGGKRVDDGKVDMDGLSKQFGGKSKGYEQTGQSDRTWGAIRDDIKVLTAKHKSGVPLNATEVKRLQYYHAGITALDRGSSVPTAGGPTPVPVGTPSPMGPGQYFATGGSGTAELIARQAYDAMEAAKSDPTLGPVVQAPPSGAGESGSLEY